MILNKNKSRRQNYHQCTQFQAWISTSCVHFDSDPAEITLFIIFNIHIQFEVNSTWFCILLSNLKCNKNQINIWPEMRVKYKYKAYKINIINKACDYTSWTWLSIAQDEGPPDTARSTWRMKVLKCKDTGMKLHCRMVAYCQSKTWCQKLQLWVPLKINC